MEVVSEPPSQHNSCFLQHSVIDRASFDGSGHVIFVISFGLLILAALLANAWFLSLLCYGGLRRSVGQKPLLFIIGRTAVDTVCVFGYVSYFLFTANEFRMGSGAGIWYLTEYTVALSFTFSSFSYFALILLRYACLRHPMWFKVRVTTLRCFKYLGGFCLLQFALLSIQFVLSIAIDDGMNGSCRDVHYVIHCFFAVVSATFYFTNLVAYAVTEIMIRRGPPKRFAVIPPTFHWGFLSFALCYSVFVIGQLDFLFIYKNNSYPHRTLLWPWFVTLVDHGSVLRMLLDPLLAYCADARLRRSQVALRYSLRQLVWVLGDDVKHTTDSVYNASKEKLHSASRTSRF